MTEEASSPKLKKGLWIATICFLFILLIFLAMWLIWWRFEAKTKDAYVNGNMVIVTPKQKGIITTILADNTQLVEAGQPLLELDRHEYEIALHRAKAELGSAVRQAAQSFIKVKELEAKRDANRSHFLRACLDYKHRKELVADQSVSQEDFEHSQSALFSAFSLLREVDQELESARVQAGRTTIAHHPLVEKAKANLEMAFLELNRCVIKAPVRGIVAQRKTQVGEWVQPSDPLLCIVPTDQIWVDANYREVSLKHLRIGQPAILYSDMYGKRVRYRGKIAGFNPGTGSVFSVLPPQNASGNWIKIIQRLPVKISLDPKEVQEFPLWLGLSMTVSIDIHDQSSSRIPEAASDAPIYHTNIYTEELNGVEDLIRQIIKDQIENNDSK